MYAAHVIALRLPWPDNRARIVRDRDNVVRLLRHLHAIDLAHSVDGRVCSSVDVDGGKVDEDLGSSHESSERTRVRTLF